jgi:ABC-type multidrug transport system fused ATPase/permease subunit
MKTFIRRLFIISDPLIDGQADERIQRETHEEYARVYFLFVALSVIVTFAQLFLTRQIIAFLPAIIGTGGSLAYFIFRYIQEGLLSSHETDERIADYKARVKSRCFIFCLSVYVIVALPMLFFDVPILMLWAVYLTWFVPAAIAVVRITKRGLYASGTKREAKNGYRKLAKATAKSAIGFGIFMSLFTGFFIRGIDNFSGVWDILWRLSRDAFLLAAFWGVFFYFSMIGLDKISERFGKKRLNNSEEESGK